ncbi:hypothetical protein J6590_017122 [Homalodisca vitripennis]|nr:hypothetical protein J6590_017122 [Homalodisca vitripennis]
MIVQRLLDKGVREMPQAWRSEAKISQISGTIKAYKTLALITRVRCHCTLVLVNSPKIAYFGTCRGYNPRAPLEVLTTRIWASRRQVAYYQSQMADRLHSGERFFWQYRVLKTVPEKLLRLSVMSP